MLSVNAAVVAHFCQEMSDNAGCSQPVSGNATRLDTGVPRPLLAVALGAATMAEARATLPAVCAEAELVELRLDLMAEEPDLAWLLRARGKCPVIATLRPVEQGGKSVLSPADRLGVLLRAVDLGAEYVDLEWDAAIPDAVQRVHRAGARVVVSRHDSDAMPAELARGWWDDLAGRGADVVKVVGTARGARDGLAVLRAFRYAHRPTIAIAMGEVGIPTRILALREPRCFLTFAAPTVLAGTAPGQVKVGDMRGVYHADRVGPSTRVFGLLDARADHALAGQYNDWFGQAGLDAVAIPFPLAPGDDAGDVIEAYRELPVSGWHVHGAAGQAGLRSSVRDVDMAARTAGKVNGVLVLEDGQTLRGTWVESPAEQFFAWTGVQPGASR